MYQFCPRCGNHPLQEINENNHRRQHCTACDFIYYNNPKPTATAIITDQNNRILLGRRGREPFKDWWDVPGGFIEFGEHPEAAVKREIMEELGVEIAIQRLLGIFMDTYDTTGDSTLNIHYLATIGKGDPKAGDDLVDCKWFNHDNLPQNIAFKNGQEAVAAWLKSLK